MASNDPDFERKTADIIGLYLDSFVDEKTATNADLHLESLTDFMGRPGTRSVPGRAREPRFWAIEQARAMALNQVAKLQRDVISSTPTDAKPFTESREA